MFREGGREIYSLGISASPTAGVEDLDSQSGCKLVLRIAISASEQQLKATAGEALSLHKPVLLTLNSEMAPDWSHCGAGDSCSTVSIFIYLSFPWLISQLSG